MFLFGVLCLVATIFAFPHEAVPEKDIEIPETDLHTNLLESIKVSEATKEEVKDIKEDVAKVNVLVAPLDPSALETVAKTIPETELHTNIHEPIKVSEGIEEEVEHIKENEAKLNVLVNSSQPSAQETIMEEMPEIDLHSNIHAPINVSGGIKEEVKYINENEAKGNVLVNSSEPSAQETIMEEMPEIDLHTNIPETITVSVKEENVKDIKEDKSKVNLLTHEVIAPKTVVKIIPKANLRTNLSKDLKVSEVKKVKEIKDDEAKVNKLPASYKPTASEEDKAVPETLHVNAPEPNEVKKENGPKMIVLASLPDPPKLPPMHKSIREYLNGEIKDHRKIQTSIPNIRFQKAPIVRILNIYS